MPWIRRDKRMYVYKDYVIAVHLSTMTHQLWFFDDFKVVITCFKISISHAKRRLNYDPSLAALASHSLQFLFAKKPFEGQYIAKLLGANRK